MNYEFYEEKTRQPKQSEIWYFYNGHIDDYYINTGDNSWINLNTGTLSILNHDEGGQFMYKNLNDMIKKIGSRDSRLDYESIRSQNEANYRAGMC